MKQRSLTDGFDKFRNHIEVISPWQDLVEIIELFYPKPMGVVNLSVTFWPPIST